MAEFIVRNSLNPYKAVKFGVTTRQVVPKEGKGKPVWVIEVVTGETTVSGVVIPPEYINLRTLDNLDEEIQNAVAIISDKIDWSQLIEDYTSPFVLSSYPENDVVNIESSIEVVLKDTLPSSGIDKDSIKMTVNGFDVTSELEISGIDNYLKTIKWKPYLRYYGEV